MSDVVEDVETIIEGENSGADGKIPCARCGKLFVPSGKHRKYHSTACRKAADKDRERNRKAAASSGAGEGPKPKPKHSRSMWLVRKEAEVIGYIIQFFALRRTGLALRPPDENRREHLAHVLKKLETQPPFSYIQQALYRLFPVFDPEIKPGRSVFGDAAQYAWGWYEENPQLQAALGDAVPPFLRPTEPGAAQPTSPASPNGESGPGEAGEEIYREPITYQEYMYDPTGIHREEPENE